MSKMIDIDDYVEKQNKTKKENTSLTPTDHLEAILFQFVTLYERWSEDRQVAAKQGADIAKLVKDFSKEVSRFGSLDDALREKIKECIHSESKSMAIYMGRTVSDAATKEIELTSKKLSKSVDEAEKTLSRYQSEAFLAKWLTISLTVFTSLVISLVVVWFLMPNPVLPLTDSQIKSYQNGIIFNAFWDKLSIRQKNWLLNVASGKSNNREKLVEDIKTEYPDLNDSQIKKMIENKYSFR